jgi:hypothetical protein
VARRNRPLLDNGSVNTHSRVSGYADYSRRTAQESVMFTVRTGYKRTRNSSAGSSRTGVVRKVIRKTDVSGKEDSRDPGRNGMSLRQSPIVNCYK